MALQQGDVKRISEAYDKAAKAFETGHVREAGKVLCTTLKDLLSINSFWQGVQVALDKARQYKVDGDKLLDEITRLVDEVGRVYSDLAIDPAQWGPMVADVFAAHKVTAASNLLSVPELQLLRGQLEDVADLICEESGKNRAAFAMDWITSVKGKEILADAGIVAIAAPVLLHAPPLAYAVLVAGLGKMKRDIQDISNFLKKLRKH